MAGLLDFALGFGAGAAGGFVEQKKADLEAQRQANLARLQAKYKSEEQFSQAERIARMGRSDDPLQQDTARILGYTPREIPEPDYVTFVDPTNRDAPPIQFDVSTQEGRQAAREARENNNLMQINTPTMTQLGQGAESENLTADERNFNAQVAIEMRLDPNLSETDAIRRVYNRVYLDSGEVFEPQTEEHGGLPYLRTGPLELFRLEPTAPGGRIRVTNADGTIATANDQDLPNYAVPTQEVPESLRRQVGPDLSAMPPADYISLGTGPVDTLLGAGLRIPIIGELLAANSESSGSLQRAASLSVSALRNDIVRMYRNNQGRTTNMDMELNLALVPKDGLWSTSASFYADASQLRREIVTDINRNNQILNSFRTEAVPQYSPDQREAAMQFLADAQGLMAKLDGYLTAYGFENKSINYKGANVRIRDLTEAQINNLSPQEYMSLDPQMANLVDAWAQYNNFTITD